MVVVVSVLAATVVMGATENASVASAKNAVQDNPARKVRNVVRAVNAIAPTRRATNVQTRPPMRRSLQPADPSKHHQPKNRARNSSPELL